MKRFSILLIVIVILTGCNTKRPECTAEVMAGIEDTISQHINPLSPITLSYVTKEDIYVVYEIEKDISKKGWPPCYDMAMMYLKKSTNGFREFEKAGESGDTTKMAASYDIAVINLEKFFVESDSIVACAPDCD